MRPRRLGSISGLMAFVLLCGVGVAALRSPTLLWVRATSTLALASLGLAIVGILYRDGARRAFWAGFLIFGGGYWVAAMAPWIAKEVRTSLLTEAGVERLYVWIPHKLSDLDNVRLRQAFETTEIGADMSRRLEGYDSQIDYLRGSPPLATDIQSSMAMLQIHSLRIAYD